MDQKKNQQKEYHNFIAPIYMNGQKYRARIVEREKTDSDILYIIDVELLPEKNGASGPANTGNVGLVDVPSDISIDELVDGVKIYDYEDGINYRYDLSYLKFSRKYTPEEQV